MEEVKRLQPTAETLRRLFVLSGNQCAFPGCVQPLFNGEGNFVGQICHIEAAMPGGERFNKNMTNEDRRSFNNLMLMCYEHHIETNKVNIYKTEVLRDFKKKHESMYENVDRFIRQMQSTIIDVTTIASINKINSLSRLHVDASGKDFREPQHIHEDAKIFNDALPIFLSLSPDAKRIFSIALSRSRHKLNIYGRESEEIYFDALEIERVTGVPRYQLNSIFHEIEMAGFIYWSELDDTGIVVPFIIFPNSETNFWGLMKDFCFKKNIDLIDILDRNNFSIFD